jgi:predicted RNA-binding protein with PIN domain
LGAESTQYMSRYEHMIDEQQTVCFVAHAVATCHKTYNMLLFNLTFTSGHVFC